MTKLYIQKETSEPVDQIIFDSGKESNNVITLSKYSLDELRVENDSTAVYIDMDNIDVMIEALQKAKEIWG